ncbi:MAG: NAD(P)-dependent glycerol-3-phosphate dehydrogenase [bacterium]|nr:NAD(P)-dependent glycerol-3-phosphate dehydrogenase [bacterium]
MKACVLGGGSWGATFAKLLSEAKLEVVIWEYNKDRCLELEKNRSLKTLPQLKLPKDIVITNNKYEASIRADILVIAIPSKFVRDTLKSLKIYNSKILSLTKGIETSTLKRISEVIYEETGILPTVLSGPSHAEEVCLNIPTAVTVVGKDAQFFQKLLNTKTFRVYTSDDIIGVELGGALKNIYAIVKGIVDGLGFGDNTKAAVVTRSLYEMVKIGVIFGAKPHTFFGLSGIGDLVVTCYSIHSRNRLFGEKIGKGIDVDSALKEVGMVVEGYETVKVVPELERRYAVDIPLARGVYDIVYFGAKPSDVIESIVSRPIKSEWNIKV